MAEAPNPNDQHRVPLSRASAERLKKMFPGASYEDSIVWLMNRFEGVAGDHSNCANTELWIKLDRLEEAFSLLALANVDLADIYRRQVGGEIARIRNVSCEVAELSARIQEDKS